MGRSAVDHDAVQHPVHGAITADGDKVADTIGDTLAGQFGFLAGAGGHNNIKFAQGGLQAGFDFRPELSSGTLAGRWIDKDSDSHFPP